jgi:hypothetical protein
MIFHMIQLNYSVTFPGTWSWSFGSITIGLQYTNLSVKANAKRERAGLGA